MKFVVFRNVANQYAWRLVASNGKIIANGESYLQKASCLNAIKVLVGLSLDRFFIYQDVSGFWRWNAKALNNEIIAQSSESYFNKKDCEDGARLAYTATTATPIEDLTQPAGAIR